MNYYAQLVEKLGEDKARERMRLIRKNRVKPGYFATLNKQEITAISKKGGKAKKHGKSQEPEAVS